VAPSFTLPPTGLGGLLVLIGGGEFSFGETEEVDRFVFGRMPERSRTVAFLPTASGSPEYATHFGAYLGRLGIAAVVENVPVYRGRDVRRARNLETIRSAGAVYIGGGVTNRLVEVLRDSPVLEAIAEASRRGAVVAAIGGAAAALGGVAIDAEWPSGRLAGLGILGAAVVEAGFEPGYDERLRRFASLPQVGFALGIPRATAVAISPGGDAEVVGEGEVAVIRKPARQE
jgi:cyanophycinase-like exopeptidase